MEQNESTGTQAIPGDHDSLGRPNPYENLKAIWPHEGGERVIPLMRALESARALSQILLADGDLAIQAEDDEAYVRPFSPAVINPAIK